MPTVDGRRVADGIKAQSARTPVIMLTGWGSRMIAEKETPPNVDRVLGKPPKLQELRAAIRDLCMGHSPFASKSSTDGRRYRRGRRARYLTTVAGVCSARRGSRACRR